MSRSVLSYTIFDYFVITVIVSFLGYLLENIWLIVRKGYIDNRNMNFPFLIGYGIAIMFIWLTIGVPDKKHILIYYGLCFLIVSLGEIILGTTVEKLCNIHYWDYTSLPFHFTRYTSLFTSLGFSLIITLFMWKCFCPLMDMIHSRDTYPMHVLSTVLIAVLLIDFLFSFGYMISGKTFYDSWRLTFPTKETGFEYTRNTL